MPVYALQQLNFEGFIADEAHILSDGVKNDLNVTLLDLQKKSGADIAVVTLNSLDGTSVEDTALQIGRTYKVGSREKLNGVVFLTAIDDREMRIEIGTGLENKISTDELSDIRDKDILPYYRQSDYQSGIARGTYQLAELVAHVEGVKIQQQGLCPAEARQSSDNNSENTPWWVYVIAFILSIFSPRRKRFNSGSFGGFGGGGSFGGCGISGHW